MKKTSLSLFSKGKKREERRRKSVSCLSCVCRSSPLSSHAAVTATHIHVLLSSSSSSCSVLSTVTVSLFLSQPPSSLFLNLPTQQEACLFFFFLLLLLCSLRQPCFHSLSLFLRIFIVSNVQTGGLYCDDALTFRSACCPYSLSFCLTRNGCEKRTRNQRMDVK